MTMMTTLADIRAAKPCETFSKICDHFGVSTAEAKTHREPFPVALLLETNGLDDTLWVIDNVAGNQHLARLFAADCAESVLHLFERERPNDSRPREAIASARNPKATERERAAAGAAARDAARDAAWDAARDAARDAAGAAARDAAGAAAWDAAGDAARDAQIQRLKQYLEHGESASNLPWGKTEKAEKLVEAAQ